MIQSMTGYGAATRASVNYKVTVELKSLNSKFLEIQLKLPRAYLKYEHKLRAHLGQELQRGKVLVLLNVEVLNADKNRLNINPSRVEGYYNELKQLQEQLALPGEIDLNFLLNLPDVIPVESEVEDPEQWELIEQATYEACERMIESRNTEGAALDVDLSNNVLTIASSLAQIEELAPTRRAYVENRLEQALEEIRSRIGDFDRNRFEQELIFYVEKLDINEEIVRLTQHIRYFRELQGASVSNGKKMQFISQEMGREINTIGAKANDATLQRLVVSMKDALEKIKEQVFNIV